MTTLNVTTQSLTGMPVIQERKRFEDTAKWRDQFAVSGSLIVLSGTAEKRINVQEVRTPEIKEDQGKIFGPQGLDEVLVFPKPDRIVLLKEGLFIPRSIFGRDAQLNYTQQGAGATLVVTVSSGSEQNRRLQSTDRTRELEWLDKHGEEYVGQWVALEGERLVAASPRAADVFREVRSSDVQSPFVVKIEPKTELPFGGW